MQALILAAGRGQRMGALTSEKPKGLTLLAGKTLLRWQSESLKLAGIEEISAIGGYLHSHVDREIPVHFINERWSETNMVISLAAADSLLTKEECIIVYSDIVFHPDIVKKLIGAPQSSIAITYDADWERLWSERFDDPLTDAETFRINELGQVKEIGFSPDSLNEIQGQFMGLMRISPEGWRAVRSLLKELDPYEQDQLDVTTLLMKLVTNSVDVLGIKIKGRWLEVDTHSDLTLYERKIANATERRQDWSHDWRW